MVYVVPWEVFKPSPLRRVQPHFSYVILRFPVQPCKCFPISGDLPLLKLSLTPTLPVETSVYEVHTVSAPLFSSSPVLRPPPSFLFSQSLSYFFPSVFQITARVPHRMHGLPLSATIVCPSRPNKTLFSCSMSSEKAIRWTIGERERHKADIKCKELTECRKLFEHGTLLYLSFFLCWRLFLCFALPTVETIRGRDTKVGNTTASFKQSSSAHSHRQMTKWKANRGLYS